MPPQLLNGLLYAMGVDVSQPHLCPCGLTNSIISKFYTLLWSLLAVVRLCHNFASQPLITKQASRHYIMIASEERNLAKTKYSLSSSCLHVCARTKQGMQNACAKTLSLWSSVGMFPLYPGWVHYGVQVPLHLH